MLNKKLEAIEIDGKKYYTLEQFAMLTGKSVQTIRFASKYIRNRDRKLKTELILNRLMVPESELYDYQWEFRGRKDSKVKLTYTFNKEGEKIFHKDIKL